MMLTGSQPGVQLGRLGGRTPCLVPGKPTIGCTKRGRALQVVAFKDNNSAPQQQQPLPQSPPKDSSRVNSGLQESEVPLMTGVRGSVVAIVLGGGATDYDKLFPLTMKRALPAVPVAGTYRLIDIPMTNLIHSGINKVYVVTQFQSQSLNRYLTQTYNMSGGVPLGGNGFIEILSASQSPVSSRWSQGTADAVRQFVWLLEDIRSKRQIHDVIILPADQLYRADFSWVVDKHREDCADITILCQGCDEQQTSQLGIAQVDCPETGEGCVVTAFEEKPAGEARSRLRTDPATFRAFKAVTDTATAPSGPIRRGGGPWSREAAEAANARNANNEQQDGSGAPGGKDYLASTGIYVIKRSTLVEMLQKYTDANDFGTEIIPQAVKDGYKVLALNMPGAWRDVGGSIKDYYEASMEMAAAEAIVPTCTAKDQKEVDARMREVSENPHPFFEPSLSRLPLFQLPAALQPVRYGTNVSVATAIVSPGTSLGDNVKVRNSIVGARSTIGANCVIDHSVVMGADYYEHEHDQQETAGAAANLPIGIGEGSEIRRAIVDKNAHIGRNVRLVNEAGLRNSADYAAIGVYIRDGIVVVAKDAVVPDNTVI